MTNRDAARQTESQSVDRFLKRYFTLLIAGMTFLGALLMAGAALLHAPNSVLYDVVLGIGLSLFAAGVTTIAVTYFANEILEDKMVNAVSDEMAGQVDDLTDAAKKSLLEFNSTVQRGTESITKRIEDIVPLFLASSRLGLESAHLTRTEALKSFVPCLVAEFAKAKRFEEGSTKQHARLWIVSSSMKGFLSTATQEFDGRETIRRAARQATACPGSLDLRILMTHPDRGDERATQERRNPGAIPAEIEDNLADLRSAGVAREMIKLYSGTPTVFAVATSEWMLLNPYPYGREAYRCFCIVVRRTPETLLEELDTPTDIYRQYLAHHFVFPWERAEPAPKDHWDSIPTPPGTDESTTEADPAQA